MEPPFGFDVVNMRKLPAIEVPCSMEMEMEMEMDMNRMQWLRRNVKPFEGALLIGMHLVQSATVEALPGYVDFRGIKRIESSTYAGMPAGATRDLSDLILLNRDGETRAQVLDMLYGPANGAAALIDGANTVAIGDSGYVEVSGVPGDQFRIVCEAAYRWPDAISPYHSASPMGAIFMAGSRVFPSWAKE